jgi:malonyl-CoA/methylmalonyl-CoA synthetase
MLQVIERAHSHRGRVAIIADSSRYTYDDLLKRSAEIASFLLQEKEDLQEARIAFMVPPGLDYVATLWGIWRAGGVAVPLCLTHPAPALEHVLRDTGASIILSTQLFIPLLLPLGTKYGAPVSDVTRRIQPREGNDPNVAPGRRALILYTSGTTNLPKGVVTTHRNLSAQIQTLVKSWQWSEQDHTLCVLPLHHVHGIVNVVSCSLWAGACCEFLPDFQAPDALRAFRRREINVFMAVPTIYFKLIAAWETLPTEGQQEVSAALAAMRLMVSGSAALPVSVMERWERISGHRLLERYGMTELGMAISNPYEGERRAGYVGTPLPGVEIRLCDDKDQPVTGEPGEIQVRGENVFQEYWKQPEATAKSFTKDGWFKTGDVAVIESGYYRILGRSSVDIIKSGGYKISALEIEEVLRTHPDIKDCAVVGLDDEEWGEIVAAGLVAKGPLDMERLRTWLKERIPGYRIPRKFLLVEELPRNAMGKVTKSDVKKLFVV